MKTFFILFDNLMPIHRHKDVVEIPLALKRLGVIQRVRGFPGSNMADVDGVLTIAAVWRTFWVVRILAILMAVFREVRPGDIVNCYHFSLRTLTVLILLRLFIGKKVIIYLRADMNRAPRTRRLAELMSRGAIEAFELSYLYLASRACRLICRLVDIVSVESCVINESARYWPGEVILVSYGHSFHLGSIDRCLKGASREPQVVHVARLGDGNKRSEAVVQAFLRAKYMKGWSLKLVGQTTENFGNWLESFVDSTVNDRAVERTGVLDYHELSELLVRSRICVVASRSESGPLVAVEAVSLGLTLVSTSVGVVEDLAGDVVLVSEQAEGEELVDEIALALHAAAESSQRQYLSTECGAYETYKWDHVVAPLAHCLQLDRFESHLLER